ncbi:MAG: glycosyltransferase family 4 protein [Acidobacteriota bacterium]
MHLAYLHYLYGRSTALLHVEQFAAAARQLGHRVDVHAMNLAPPPLAAGGPQKASSMALKVRQALKSRFSRYLHDPKEAYWNLRYVRREKALLAPDPPDVLLVRSQGLAASCVPVARHLEIPLVLEVNAPTEELTRYIDRYVHWTTLRRRVGAYKLRAADAIVVVSTALKDYYIERLGIDPDKITVAVNGADVDLFTPRVAPDAEFPKEPGAPWIGYVGSFQKWHALDFLGSLVRRVGARRPRTRFMMVGSGPGAEDVRRSADVPSERLVFTGRVEHQRVPHLVASLDIGVLAEAASYQCPLKVIEWMAAGKAIVAPAYGPLRDLIDDGVHGILFEPGNLDALVEAVIALVDDPERRVELGRAAAARAHESLSWRDNARTVVAACERAARRRGAGR